MKSYMVSYDLIKRKDYPELWNALKAYNWWHCLGSTWIITSDETAMQIATKLLKHIDDDDRLIVNQLVKNDSAWTQSFSQQCKDWLNSNL